MRLERLLIAFISVMVSCVSHDINPHVTCARSQLTLSLVSVKDATSCSDVDGEIQIDVAGGESPYKLQLNNQDIDFQKLITGLSSGIYSIGVTDKNACEAVLSNIVVLADNFQFSTTTVDDTGCINHNGSITINVQEGTAPFSYKLNNGVATDNNFFSNLSAGNYNIGIEDAAGCTALLHVTVPKGSTNTSWSGDILPIMTSSCAVNGCHDGKTRIDYRIYNNVKNNAAKVKLYTSDGTMPFDGPSLTQTQIDLIACWVDDGAANN